MRGAGICFGAVLAAALVLFADDFTYSGDPIVDKPAYVIATTNALPVPGDRIRIATYNIETFEDGIGDNPERTPEVAARQARMAAALIDRIHPDVLLVQEIENGGMLDQLNRAMASPYAGGCLTGYGTGSTNDVKLNDGILSRFEIRNPTEIDFGPLTGPGRPTRGLLRFEVDVGDHQRLLVYDMHLKSNFGNKPRNIAERQAALKLLREDADKVTKSGPETKWEIVAAGDTNVDPDQPGFAEDPSFSPMEGWVDLWRKVPGPQRVTIPTRHGDPTQEFPPAAFDRFFVSPEMTGAPWTASLPVSVQEGCDTNNVNALPGTGVHVSDHYPVYLDLTR